MTQDIERLIERVLEIRALVGHSAADDLTKAANALRYLCAGTGEGETNDLFATISKLVREAGRKYPDFDEDEFLEQVKRHLRAALSEREGWVRVEERLPDPDDLVLTWNKNGFVNLATSVRKNGTYPNQGYLGAGLAPR